MGQAKMAILMIVRIRFFNFTFYDNKINRIIFFLNSESICIWIISLNLFDFNIFSS